MADRQNITYAEELVVWLKPGQVNADAIAENTQGYTIVVAPAANTGRAGQRVEVFSSQESKGPKSLWARFWRTSKEKKQYTYYLVDTRRRNYSLTTEVFDATHRYRVRVDVTFEYQVEEPVRAALRVEDPLQLIIDRIKDVVEKCILAQSFIALNGVKETLDGKMPYQLAGFYEDLGLEVYRKFKTTVTLPEDYQEAYRAEVSAATRVEQERIRLEREAEEARNKAEYDVTTRKVEADRLAGVNVQDNRISVIEEDIEQRQTRRQVISAQTTGWVQREEVRIEQERQLREQANEEELRRRELGFQHELEATLQTHELLLRREKIDFAFDMLERMGITVGSYPMIMRIVLADPEDGWQVLSDMTQDILRDRRESAKRALDQYIDINRRRIEAQEIDPRPFNEFMEQFIAATADADMVGYISGGKRVKQLGDSADTDEARPTTDYDPDAVDDFMNVPPRDAPEFDDDDQVQDYGTWDQSSTPDYEEEATGSPEKADDAQEEMPTSDSPPINAQAEAPDVEAPPVEEEPAAYEDNQEEMPTSDSPPINAQAEAPDVEAPPVEEEPTAYEDNQEEDE